MAVTLRVKNIEKLTEQLALGRARPVIRLGVQVSEPAAEYAMIWEWGRTTCEPGPKTLWSTNADGETVVLTKTAPFGYIRVNKTKYKEFIKEEMAKINFHKLKPSQWNKQFELALNRAARRCADLIADTAPIDTGFLQEEIRTSQIVDTSTVVDKWGMRKGLHI